MPEAELLGRFDDAWIDLVVWFVARSAERPGAAVEARGAAPVGLGTAKVRQHAGVIPARQTALSPVVVVRRTTTHMPEGVDQMRATQPLAGRRRRAAHKGSGRSLNPEPPRQLRIAESITPSARNTDAEIHALVRAGLDEQHIYQRSCGEACGHH